MHDIAICYLQHCQAMLEHGVCERARAFFHFVNSETYVGRGSDLDWLDHVNCV